MRAIIPVLTLSILSCGGQATWNGDVTKCENNRADQRVRMVTQASALVTEGTLGQESRLQRNVWIEGKMSNVSDTHNSLSYDAEFSDLHEVWKVHLNFASPSSCSGHANIELKLGTVTATTQCEITLARQ